MQHVNLHKEMDLPPLDLPNVQPMQYTLSPANPVSYVEEHLSLFWILIGTMLFIGILLLIIGAILALINKSAIPVQGGSAIPNWILILIGIGALIIIIALIAMMVRYLML